MSFFFVPSIITGILRKKEMEDEHKDKKKMEYDLRNQKGKEKK